MKHFKGMKHPIGFGSLIGLIIFLSLLLEGCVPLLPQGQSLGLSQSNNPYSGSRSSSRRRSSSNRYSGRDCGENEDCEDICRRIYRRSTVKNKCLDLPEDQVEQLEYVYDTLKTPRLEDLTEIDSEDFDVFVRTDIQTLNTLIGQFNTTEGKEVLAWIADNSDIAEVFMNVDGDYNLLERLLNALDDDTDQEALDKTINDGKSFMELAIDNGGVALDWVHNFIVNKCDNQDPSEEVCVFKEWYCETIKASDEQSWSSLVKYERFESIANEILSEYTTTYEAGGDPDDKTGRLDRVDWWTDEVNEVRELREERQLAELCSVFLVQRSN